MKIATIGILFGLLAALLIGSVRAHDVSRPELNHWFDKLASQKGPCCSMADGLSLADVDWESRNGRYWVNLEKQWVEVEDSALIKQPNLAGRAWVWPFKGTDGQIIIRCFMPGSMT